MCFMPDQGQCQITVTNSNNASILAQKLVGPGVIISNTTVQCNGNQSGVFVTTSSNLGIDSGIVLTTGFAACSFPAFGVNGAQTNFASANQGTGGDAALTALAGISTYDRCILEFDFKGTGDTVYFQYVFGSEEYPVFNCSNYNDVFGFFISGPGYPTPLNIALVPGTSIPVAINSVNSGTISSGGSLANCTAMGPGSPFTSLYHNNIGGATVTYEGFTNLFTAKASIQPCSTYHLRLAIADGFDHILDSGVFLKAGSLKSNNLYLSVESDSINGNVPYVFEGCDSATIKIHREIFQSAVNADTIYLNVLGSATNGVDYPLIQTSFVFSNSITDTLKTFSIKPLNDMITEGVEFVKIVLLDICNATLDSVRIDIKDPPSFQITTNDTLICEGDAVLINGVYDNGLQFSWQPTIGVNNPSSFHALLSPTTTTTYSLTASYGNCASVIDSIKITVQPTPTISTTPNNATCFGMNTGSIQATGNVNSNPLIFSIVPTNTSLNGSPATFNNLAVGTYTVTISSGLGCTKTSVATISQPLAMSWSVTNVTNIPCNAGNIGAINCLATGGTGSISYTIIPGNITNSSGIFNSLSAGNYIVTAKDANNCSINTSLIITQAIGFSWNPVTKTNINCNGNANGIISLSVGGAIGGVTYLLQPLNISNSNGFYSALGPATYTITATDGLGCVGTTTVVITQPPLLTLTPPSITNLVCNGTNSGSINTVVNGGTSPYIFILNPIGNISTSGLFSNIPANTYTVSVSDSNNCNTTVTANVTQPPHIIISNITKVNPTCLPGNNGSIVVTASGGVSTLTYKLNSGAFQSSNAFTGLGTGNFVITVKDANGCTISTSVSMVTSNSPSLGNNSLLLPCTNGNGTINVAAYNGTPPYTYTLFPVNISNTIGTFTNVPVPGAYWVSVVDSNGCNSTLAINLILPPPMAWSSYVQTNIPCNGIGTGSIHATTSGGTGVITYQITPPGTTNTTGIFNSLPLNTYTVLATDVNGCTVTSITSIIISPPLAFLPPNINNVLCHGQSNGTVDAITGGGSGVINYTLNPGNSTNTNGSFTNLSAGTYTISAVDGTNCTNSTTLTITEPNALLINSVNLIPPNCISGGNGIITVVASGGVLNYTYGIDTMNYQVLNTFNNLNAALYTVTVKDANSCTQSSLVNLLNPNAPIITSMTAIPVQCFGNSSGQIIVQTSSGTGLINYTINPLGIINNSGVFNSLSNNLYTVTVTDAIGCTVTSTANVTQPQALVWSNTSSTPVTCNGSQNGVLNVAASGGTGVISYNLMPGNVNNNTGTFNLLSANTYTVKAIDANGCSVTTSLIITQPASLFWSNVSKINANCFNATNGTITALCLGGNGIINYTLSPGGISNTNGLFNTLSANNYTITASDVNGCSITSLVSVTQPNLLTITNISNTIPNCVPGNNATITVSVTGGTPAYSYSLNNSIGQSSNIFTNIGASTYTVQVSDLNGCTATSSVIVNNPVPPTISNLNPLNILCFGDNTGSITTIASGGTGAFTYNISPLGTVNATGVFSNLFVNNYTVKVTDANGCTATSSVILTQPPSFIWDSVNNRDISCFLGSNGLVSSSASGGAGGFFYTLYPGNITNSNGAFFGLTMANYTLVATDLNGCTITSTFYINQFPQIQIATSNTIPPTCVGSSTGSLSITASGGAGNFTYDIVPGSVSNTTGIFNNLSAGLYTITATDINSCSTTTVLTINPPTPVQLTNISTSNASCFPGCDAHAVVTATGGNGTYYYSYNGGFYQTNNTFNNLCTSNYTVTIKDGNNCTATGTFVITTANGPSQINSIANPVSCFNASNGSIATNAIGGSGIISYTLIPGNILNTTGLFSNLSAGNYTITASDALGCSISTISNLLQAPQIIFNTISSTNISCYNGSNGTITLSATGGTGVINYTIAPSNQTNTTGQFANLPAANYIITASDNNNCTASTSVVLTAPTAIQFSASSSNPTLCLGSADGSVTVNANGGTGIIHYTLQPTNQNNTLGQFNALAAGNYIVTATDSNACSQSINITVTQPTALLITQITSTIPSCIPGGDASMNVTASGANPPYTYSLNGGAFQNASTFTNLSVGVYTVVVKDANGCTASSTTIITTPNAPVITNITMTKASCNPGCDGSLTIYSNNGIGAHTYSLNGGPFQSATLFNSLCANTYTLVVKDANGCTSTATVTVLTNPGPVLLNTNSTNIQCNSSNNGSISLSVIGGTGVINYVLTPGSITNNTGSFTNLAAGNYSITGTDANGCTISTTVSIVQPASLIFNNISSTNISCNNGSNGTITLSAIGGTGVINYTIAPSNQTNTTGQFANLPAANYTITASDNNNCTASTSVVITEPSAIQFTLSSSSPTLCSGSVDGSITVNATGGTGLIHYTLQPTNQNNTLGQFNGLAAGNYIVTATDSNACSQFINITVTQPTALFITQITSTIPSCIPGGDASMTITASGANPPYTYSLNAGAFQNASTFTNLSVGVHTVVVKDANGCTASSTTIITTPNAPVISNITMTKASCNPGCDGSLTISSNNGIGAHTYSLNGGPFQSATLFNSLCANTYTIVVKDANGCTSSATANVFTYPSPVLLSTNSLNISCFGGNNGSITLNVIGGTGVINYILMPGNASNNTGAFSNLIAGNYSITGTDAHGCTVATNITLTQPNALSFSSIIANGTLCSTAANGGIIINTVGGTPTVTYALIPSGTYVAPNVFTNLNGNTTYTVLASDANGCSLTSSIFVAQPTSVVINSVYNNAVTCNQLSNGSISVNASGGTGVLNYTLFPLGVTNTNGFFNGLSGNTYSILVTDANGCTSSSSTVVIEPPAINILNTSATNVVCHGENNGIITINSSGGVAPLAYQIQPLNLNTTSGIFSNLPGNAYTVTTIDANACSISTILTIVDPPLLHFTNATQTNVLCFGDGNATISSAATGGVGLISYTINPGNITNATGNFNGLSSNTYTIEAKDANNCSTSTTIVILEPLPLGISLLNGSNVTCHGANNGSLSAAASGGAPPYLFTLLPIGVNSSSGAFPNIYAGTYTIVVQDANGCENQIPNIDIAEPSLIYFNDVRHQDITCYSDTIGTIHVEAAGGVGNISFTLMPNNGVQNTVGDFSSLPGGTYIVTAIDANGCTMTTQVIILQNLEIDPGLTLTEPVCHGDSNGSVIINATGGVPPLSYSFNGSPLWTTNIYQNLKSGTYSLTIVDAKGCSKDTLFELKEPDKVGAEVSAFDSKCIDHDGGKIIVKGTGGRSGYTYYLKPGLYINQHGTFVDLKVNTYTVIVMDSSGCLFDTLATIAQPTNVMSVAFTKKDIGCFGFGNEGWILATPSGGDHPYSYEWSTEPKQVTAEIDGLRSGLYTVKITDGTGCILKDSIYLEPGPCCDEVYLPNAFSPNGDQNNDVWRVVTAAGIEMIQLDIYDRWGNKVWGTSDIADSWDGTLKGKMLDVNTYYFIFRYKCLADGEKHVKKGDIILIR